MPAKIFTKTLYSSTTISVIGVTINFLNLNNVDITFVPIIIIILLLSIGHVTLTLASNGDEGDCSTVVIIVNYRHLVWL